MVTLQTKDSANYQFEILSATGGVLMKSVCFNTKDSANKTIKDLPKLIAIQSNFERRTENNGQFVFCLKNENGSLIGKSGSYSSEVGMENGINNLKQTLLRPANNTSTQF